MSGDRIDALPAEVAGIRLVDSGPARAATALAREASPPHLFNHAARTYLFGALIGRARGGAHARCDAEALYLACILHDIGLTARFAGPRPFELEGAEAASRFLREAGYPAERIATVWDGIAMHASWIADFKAPEIALVSAGVRADVVGAELDGLSPRDVEAVLRAFPRLGFKRGFVATCAEIVARHPDGARRGFMREIGERMVPGFAPGNVCDAIEAAPFEE
jgi:HD domain